MNEKDRTVHGSPVFVLCGIFFPLYCIAHAAEIVYNIASKNQRAHRHGRMRMLKTGFPGSTVERSTAGTPAWKNSYIAWRQIY